MEPLDDLKKAHKVVSLIAVAMIVCLFIYLLIGEMIRIQFKPFSGFVQLPHFKILLILRYFFYVYAFLSIVIMKILQQVLLKKTLQDDLGNLIKKLYTSSIIVCAIGEIPAIAGLLLFLVGGLYRDFYFLLFLSLFLELVYFPKYSKWKEWVQSNHI